MKHNDWQRTEELFHAAVGLSAEERADYFASVCPEDAALRAEVESLISAFENQSGLMEHPAFSLGMKMLAGESDEKTLAGKRIGPYKILKLLGKGGMGEVYLAEDPRLDRKVALKFLSNKFTDDGWAKRQLMKEAQAVARLDHPNICAVHGFEEHDGYNFIVMQYIEGETLASLIHQKLLEPAQVKQLAVQIVSALVEAQAHGIVHRDIKPQNIMVAASGQVKVLDFGLAKLVQQRQGALGAGESETQSSQLGLVLGTVAYMSPEQLRAERLDFRSDIFSLGIVLYEMISGRNPYSCGSNAEIISAILTSEPPTVTRPAAGIPASLAHVAQKCLNRDKELRYQSASELLFDLDNPDKNIVARSRWATYYRYRAYATFALVLLITIATLFVYFRPAKAQTLAVLPIICEGANADTEYLGEGLTESLINSLSRVPKLQVKPRTLVSIYKDQKADPMEVGRDFNVDLVLLGTITQQGESLFLQVRLMKTADGSQIWRQEYRVEPERMIELLGNLSDNLASKLTLSENERRSLATHQTQNAEAYRMYIRGQYCWRKRDKGNIQKAIRYFEQAIDLDPTYAQAYAGLADCYLILSTVAYGPLPTKEAMSKAWFAAQQALNIDYTLSEAHTSLGVYQLRHEWNWQEAEKEFKQAIRFNPNYSSAHYWYSNLLALMGRSSDSIAESEKTKELDPLSPLSDMNLARAFHYARDEETSASHFRKMLEKDPNDLRALYMLGYVYERQGLYQEAINSLQKVYEKDKLWAAAPLGYLYARSGRRADAMKILNELEDASKHAYVPPQEKAIIYLGLDDKDRAFTLLREACDERFATLPFLLIEPFLDNIRSDPRFIELARRANLPQ